MGNEINSFSSILIVIFMVIAMFFLLEYIKKKIMKYVETLDNKTINRKTVFITKGKKDKE